MVDKTIKQRTERLRKKNAEIGLTQVRVWVPKGDVETVKALAEKLRAKHKK